MSLRAKDRAFPEAVDLPDRTKRTPHDDYNRVSREVEYEQVYHEEDEDEGDLLVIGIDFGTTFSGVAWATAADFAADSVNLVTSWPGTGREEGKAPTELFYEDDRIFWGYEVPADVEPNRWFKLLLVKEEDLSQELRSSEILLLARRKLRESGKTAIDLISDYLRILSKHTIEIIQKARGEEVVDALRFHYVITVPAIWKGYARQGMEEAAKKAGLLDYRAAGETKLTFAPEPEAAAFSTLCEPGRRPKPGDVYIICDAGGGTVDLISYKIAKSKPLVVHEAVEGTGGLCGGVFIDEAFELVCKTRLGRKWDRLSKAGIKDIMKRDWESGIKPQFKSLDKGKEYIVSIPAEAFGNSVTDDLKDPVIKGGRIHFKGHHIKEAFAGSFSAIDKLVDNQISMAVKQASKVSGIILVGGLGSSPYLYEHLNERYSTAGISILQSGGLKPRTAICRGAVTKGFLDGISVSDMGADVIDVDGHIINTPIRVASTVSRASYGIKFRTDYNENIHIAEDKTWCSVEGDWKAHNQMRWYLKKGENVSKMNPVRHSFYHLYTDKFPGKFSTRLWECEDEEPPSRREPSVKDMCGFNCSLDISFADLSDFKSADGSNTRKLDYELEMIPSGATLDCVVYVGGKKMGAQNAVVRFD